MNKLRAIMAYFCANYPHKSELSKARLTKLVYLADWYSALMKNRRMTDIDWVFNHYGPYVDNITDLANLDSEFSITPQKTSYGGDKYVISYNGKSVDSTFDDDELNILNTIINKTKSMYFNEFINFVYSTYPISSNERYSRLNLEKLAEQYRTTNSVS
ncbi:Panacea domain-containing protein [Pseudoalteromonas sp. 2CM36K]|uniref:Panacea domain-containing protein n=1 Tax=Pseudoalteromonas sp. 2CM36K TaxID=2929854 RepID=UPI0020BE762B|nr:Panacea domain-containing protein [Pseudoalteromonas sp. 2CM36K]MCK8104653.1 Panacea domain-containing protein [Pseudoalteromonas sp. 2CM36K]